MNDTLSYSIWRWSRGATNFCWDRPFLTAKEGERLYLALSVFEHDRGGLDASHGNGHVEPILGQRRPWPHRTHKRLACNLLAIHNDVGDATAILLNALDCTYLQLGAVALAPGVSTFVVGAAAAAVSVFFLVFLAYVPGGSVVSLVSIFVRALFVH